MITYEVETKTLNLILRADIGSCVALRALADDYDAATLYVEDQLYDDGRGVRLVKREETVGLTSAPQFCSKLVDGKPRGMLWWFPSYEIQDEWEELRENGSVVFRFGCMVRPPKPVMDLIRDDVPNGDAYGNSMSSLSDIASELWWRGDTVPPAWSFSPGATADPREPGEQMFDECEKATTAQLLYAGRVLDRYIGMLRKQGRYY